MTVYCVMSHLDYKEPMLIKIFDSYEKAESYVNDLGYFGKDHQKRKTYYSSDEMISAYIEIVKFVVE